MYIDRGSSLVFGIIIIVVEVFLAANSWPAAFYYPNGIGTLSGSTRICCLALYGEMESSLVGLVTVLLVLGGFVIVVVFWRD